MFGKAYKRIAVCSIFFSLTFLIFFISSPSAQEKGDALNITLQQDRDASRGDNKGTVVTGIVCIRPPYTFKVNLPVLEKGMEVKLIDRQNNCRYLKKDLDYVYDEDTGIIAFKDPVYDDYEPGDIDVVVTGAARHKSEIKAGAYLVSEYIETLEKTHSPYSALMSCPQPCVVTGIEGGWQASSFHEYYDCHGMESGRVDLSKGEVPYDVSITVDGDNLTLTGCCGTEGPLHFIYVGNVKRFVAGMIIEGDYVDSEGKTYSFKEDGTALFGDLRFQYEIGLDFVERWHSDKNLEMRDYFQNSKTRELYEYEIIDGMMSIYRTSGDMFQDVEPEPFLTLIKIGD